MFKAAVLATLFLFSLFLFFSAEAQSSSYAVYGINASLVSASTANLFADKCVVYLNLEKDNNIYRFSYINTRFEKECRWKVIKYLHENKEYYAILTDDINISVYLDPQWWWSYAYIFTLTFWKPEPYNHSILVYADYIDFLRTYRVAADVKAETAKDIVSIIMDPLNTITSVFRAAAELVGKATSGVIDAIKVIAAVIGRPGNVDAIIHASSYRTQLLPYINNPYIGYDVQMVLNCTKRLGEVAGLLKSFREQDLQKTICDVENEAPTGILGMLSIVFTAVVAAITMFPTIMKYFVLINAVMFMMILAFYGAKAIKKQDLIYIADGLKIIYSILKFYFNVILFIVNLIIKGIGSLSQVGQLLISIAQAIKSGIEKLIDILTLRSSI
jgi:hypothetical protein